MKKVFTMILTIMLVCIFMMPASAAEESTAVDKEMTYSTLERVAETLPNLDKEKSARFCDLSEEAIACLEENGINTDCIGKIYFQDVENEPALVAISFEENNELVITTLTSFAQNETGEYVKVPVLTIQDRGWTNGGISGSYPFTELTVSAKISMETYYINLYTMYYRPYKVEFWYTNKNGYAPVVTNVYALGIVRGELCTYVGTTFTHTNTNYDWYDPLLIATPSAGTHYSQLQYMTSGNCLDIPYYAGIQGSLYINGSYVSYTINVM